jgi:excinuclease ABC subunit C
MKFKFIKKDKLDLLPKTSGVYSFRKGKEVLYIGKAANIRKRVKQHRKLIRLAGKVGFIKTNSEFAELSAHLTSRPASQGSTIEALILEANLIKKYQPKYNVVWRDDKNYFYVGITREDFPRIFWTHQTKVKNQRSKVKSQFIGPFVDGKALKETLKVLRKVFPYRSCYKVPNRPCLWYHLNRCPAPCLLKSPKESLRLPTGQAKFIKEIPPDSLKIKKISQKNTENLIRIIEKGKNPVLKELKREMKLASAKQEFEEAAKIRNQINALEKVLAHSKIFLEPTVPQTSLWYYKKIEEGLKELLKIKKRISRIEAYDVSNIQGQEATGSLVTFINGQPDKNFYRRFKIKIEGKPNDIAMIKEVLARRFKHPEWGLPDLILIDGGIAQLNVALKIKTQKSKIKNIKVMSLAKGENKLFIEGKRKPILLKNLPRGIFNLILQLRDEAHRFAISYHRKLRKKVLLGD